MRIANVIYSSAKPSAFWKIILRPSPANPSKRGDTPLESSRGFAARSDRKKPLATQATHTQFWHETKIQEKYLFKGEFMPEALFKVVKLSLFKLCLTFVVEWCILFTYSMRAFLEKFRFRNQRDPDLKYSWNLDKGISRSLQASEFQYFWRILIQLCVLTSSLSQSVWFFSARSFNRFGCFFLSEDLTTNRNCLVDDDTNHETALL